MKGIMKRIIAPLILVALTAGPAPADVYYKTLAKSGGETPNQTMNMIAEGYVDDLKAQIYIRESGNPTMKEGMQIYTGDGGQTIYLIDPENETVSELDLAGMLKFAGAVLDSMGPLLNFEISEPQVKVLSEGPGPTVLGMSTRQYEIESHYTMLMKIIGIKRSQEIHEVSTMVTTKDLPDTAIGVWLRKDPPETGNAELDKLANGAWSRIDPDSVMVKMRTESTVISKKGKEQRSWTEFELTELDRSAGGPPGGYGYPEHYTKTALMPTAEMMGQEEGEEEEDKKGRFGGLFKKKDG